MIKEHLFLVASLSLSLQVLAQEGKSFRHPTPFKSRLEFFAGPAIVGVYDNPPFEKYGKTKIAYSVGIGLNHSLSKRITLNTRISFDRKGFKQSATSLISPDLYNNPPTADLPPVETEIKGNLNNDYVSLGVTPNLMLGQTMKLHFGVGLYYSHRIKSQITVTAIQEGQVKQEAVLNQKETYKDYDYGICFRGGYIFSLQESLIVTPQIYYSLGLMNVVNLKPGLLPMKNHSFGLAISFRISSK